MDPELPDLTKVRLNFTDAHMLDHSVWRCNSQPGGPLRHLRLRWVLQIHSKLRRNILCRAGLHAPVIWTYGAGEDVLRWQACAHCWRPYR